MVKILAVPSERKHGAAMIEFLTVAVLELPVAPTVWPHRKPAVGDRQRSRGDCADVGVVLLRDALPRCCAVRLGGAGRILGAPGCAEPTAAVGVTFIAVLAAVAARVPGHRAVRK